MCKTFDLLAPSSGRCRPRTILAAKPQGEFNDWGYGPSLWTPRNTRADSHVDRMRKISDVRGTFRRYQRTRSDTVLSSTSWLKVETNDTTRRKRAESLLSTITSGGGDVDFLCSSMPYDTLAEMMTTTEQSESGNVRLNSQFFLG